ncbi:hypothetical protein [Mycolicibacterium lacusdiani]|uniref:hypothetical protein n=1 Tax=Mycolicibacterium lacusdiani TaxID=2895283 RepID=UPI001F46121E|nr:hypothetical protein [Mycolicibacterium lacusdiani]
MTLSHRSPAADPAIALPSAEEASRATVDGALRLIAERAVGLSGAGADYERGCGLILLTRSGRRITSVGTDALDERLSAPYDDHCENPCRAAWHGRTSIRAAAPGDGECQQAWMSEASRLGGRPHRRHPGGPSCCPRGVARKSLTRSRAEPVPVAVEGRRRR